MRYVRVRLQLSWPPRGQCRYARRQRRYAPQRVSTAPPRRTDAGIYRQQAWARQRTRAAEHNELASLFWPLTGNTPSSICWRNSRRGNCSDSGQRICRQLSFAALCGLGDAWFALLSNAYIQPHSHERDIARSDSWRPDRRRALPRSVSVVDHSLDGQEWSSPPRVGVRAVGRLVAPVVRRRGGDPEWCGCHRRHRGGGPARIPKAGCPKTVHTVNSAPFTAHRQSARVRIAGKKDRSPSMVKRACNDSRPCANQAANEICNCMRVLLCL